jgi:hypothetical protein
MAAIRSVSRLAVAMLPLVLLAACGGGAAMPPATGATAGAAAPHESAALAAPADAAADPVGLKGLTPVQLRATLGDPGFTRRDTPAEIWQYRGRNCTLDLFLYDGSAGQAVAHYAVRSPRAVPVKDCVDELVQRSHAAPSS